MRVLHWYTRRRNVALSQHFDKGTCCCHCLDEVKSPCQNVGSKQHSFFDYSSSYPYTLVTWWTFSRTRAQSEPNFLITIVSLVQAAERSLTWFRNLIPIIQSWSKISCDQQNFSFCLGAPDKWEQRSNFLFLFFNNHSSKCYEICCNYHKKQKCSGCSKCIFYLSSIPFFFKNDWKLQNIQLSTLELC